MEAPKSRAPHHPSLTVSKNEGVPKTRKSLRVSGLSPPLDLRGFICSIDTLERGVLERVFFVKNAIGDFVPPPRPSPDHFRRCLQPTLNLLRKHLPSTVPMGIDDFVDTFRGRKRKIYEKAARTLKCSGVTERDAELKVFVKYEKGDFTTKTDPVPRVVSPRDPRYNVAVGRFLRPVEEPIFDALGELFGDKTVMKGMNAYGVAKCMRAKWDDFNDPVAVGLDASRFDQHVSKDALRWEHWVYRDCFALFRDRCKLGYLLNMQLENICKGYCADGKLKYRTNGVRMSGDMNTSLGNCLLMCSMVKAYSLHIGVRTKLANNGDDCVVFMERADLDRFMGNLADYFLGLGFTMVAEKPCFEFEQIEFCQAHPVYVGDLRGDYIMVRNPYTALAKDTLCLNNYNTEKMYRGWLEAVGVGGMSLAGGLPIWQAFYSLYIRYGKEWKAANDGQSWGFKKMMRGVERCYGEIKPETRASFYWAFGIDPAEQRAIEQYYESFIMDTVVRENLHAELYFQSPLPY